MPSDSGSPAPPAPRAHARPPDGSKGQSGRDEIIYAGRARHAASLGGYLKWSLASAVGGLVAYLLAMNEFFASLPLWPLALAGVPGMFWTLLTHLTTRYKISLQRVEFERGVLAKHVDSLELWRVLDVRFRQNLVDRMLGNATVILIGTDQTDPEFKLHGLPHGRRLFEQLREAVQRARHTSRPMEMVGSEGMMESLMPPSC